MSYEGTPFSLPQGEKLVVTVGFEPTLATLSTSCLFPLGYVTRRIAEGLHPNANFEHPSP